MKGLMGKPPTYLSTRPAGWEQKEQARVDRQTAELTRRQQLQAEIDAMEYRCGGLTPAHLQRERRRQRERVLSRRRPVV